MDEPSERWFEIYCVGNALPHARLTIKRLLLLDSGDGRPKLATFDNTRESGLDRLPWGYDRILYEQEPIDMSRERFSEMTRRGRPRYELQCSTCLDHAAEDSNSAAPVVATPEKFVPVIELISRHGLSEMSLTGLRGVLYR